MFPPDIDVVAVVEERVDEESLRALAQILSAAIADAAGEERCTWRLEPVGPSSDVIRLEVDHFASLTPCVVEVTIQSVHSTIAYDESFRKERLGRRPQEWEALLDEIRLLKALLRQADIYGLTRRGLPGHVAEQAVLQLGDAGRLLAATADAPPTRWDDAELFLHLPPLLQPGASARNMWAYAYRFGPANAARLARTLRRLGGRYTHAQRTDVAWTIEELAAV